MELKRTRAARRSREFAPNLVEVGGSRECGDERVDGDQEHEPKTRVGVHRVETGTLDSNQRSRATANPQENSALRHAEGRSAEAV